MQQKNVWMNIMKDKTKYLLMGIIIGIVIGVALFYILMTFRIIRPFGFSGNLGNFSGNLSRNVSRPFNRGATP